MIRRLRIAPGHVAIVASAVILGISELPLVSVSAEQTAAPTAAATVSAGPISIADGCSYKMMSSGIGMFGGNSQVFGYGYNFFTVKFTNNGAVAANRIMFQIDFGKASRIVIPDAGTFAPGATLSQTFRDNGKGMVFSARPTPNDGSVICTVLSATFTDGTTYTSPLAPIPAQSP